MSRKKAQATESKIFDLKPQLTLAMKLAATFAITYYGMFFLYEVLTLVLYHYSLDSYYLGDGEVLVSRNHDFLLLIVEFVLTGLLVFSLIQIFRKKVNGKALFVSASVLLIGFQLITSGIHPWVKYALEVLMVLIITPVRMKKKLKTKKGKLTLEVVPPEETENPETEQVLDKDPELPAPSMPSSSSEPL